jgi:hypothetical protein
MNGEPDIHESPTEELSWFTLQEHRPRHEPARDGYSSASEEARLLGDVVDTDDLSKLRVSDDRVRRSTSRRTRFQLRGH